MGNKDGGAVWRQGRFVYTWQIISKQISGYRFAIFLGCHHKHYSQAYRINKLLVVKKATGNFLAFSSNLYNTFSHIISSHIITNRIMSASQMTRTKSQLSELGSLQKRAYERHRSRVRAATPTVDVEPPQPRPHVLYNAKGLQLQRERQAVITKDNFILLKNLRDIMNRSSKKTTNFLAKPRSKCMRTR